jgi:predicted DNA-binding transcriptional regulator AlpA
MNTQHRPVFYSVKEVCQVTGLGRTTIHRLMAVNAFVAKVQLSPGRVAFRVADVAAWIDSRSQVAA